MTSTNETNILANDEARELTANEMEAIHGGNEPFLQYTLSNVYITSISLSGH